MIKNHLSRLIVFFRESWIIFLGLAVFMLLVTGLVLIICKFFLGLL